MKILLLMCILFIVLSALVIWVVGCADDDGAELVANVKSVTPADGSTNVPANIKITVEFDNPVDSCTIAGKEAILSFDNKKAEIIGVGLGGGLQKVEIKWINKDGSKGSYSLTYIVPFEIVSSSPKNWEIGVSPDDINKNGIVIEFNGEIEPKNSIFKITSWKGIVLYWKTVFNSNQVTLLPLKGAEIDYGKEYTIEGTVLDLSCTEKNIRIIFHTKFLPYVVLGTGHLIDGRDIIYGATLKANWHAKTFKMESNGKFSINIECNYLSDNPTNMSYVGSVLLMMVRAEYWSLFYHYGDGSLSPLTDVIPVVCQSSEPDSCFVNYEGNFQIPDEKIESQLLHSFEVQLSWIRVFTDDNGMRYYQWMQGNQRTYPKELELDIVYEDETGSFLVYYPKPEWKTHVLLPGFRQQFDYVSWIKQKLLHQ